MVTPKRESKPAVWQQPDCLFTLFVGGQQRPVDLTYTAMSILFEVIPQREFDAEMEKAPYRLLPLALMAGLIAGDDKYELPEGFGELEAGRWALELDEATGQRIVAGLYSTFNHCMSALALVAESETKQFGQPVTVLGYIGAGGMIPQPEAVPPKKTRKNADATP